MELRDQGLSNLVYEFERHARSIMDTEYIPDLPSPWKLDGFPFPIEDVVEMFFAWQDHGVMAVSGGYLEQPEQWRDAMILCRKIYGTRSAMVRLELLDRRNSRGTSDGK
jgi:hypothetical protein